MSTRKQKIIYYSKAIFRELLPYRYSLKQKMDSINKFDIDYIQSRVNYYNQLNDTAELGENAIYLKDFKIPAKTRVYYFDIKEYSRYFADNLKLDFFPGDITWVPNSPSIVKSRPIEANNQNAVLLNLDKVRHFHFIKDHMPYQHKKDLLIGRGAVWQKHRERFYEQYFNHPMCDLGDVRKIATTWKKDFKTIKQHLDYKYILSLEGNDVASNLKWIMSSNSIAVMPLPKYETWFMENKLIPDVHFIAIRDDYSDLEEKLSYYLEHPKQAQEIIFNANKYVDQFLLPEQEDIISLLVLKKFFEKTNQNISQLNPAPQ